MCATVALFVGGCQAPTDVLIAPKQLVAPYNTDRGELLWAVVPLRNESGVSTVDAAAMSDKLVAAAEEIQGVHALPLNRTLEAMRSLKMGGVQTPGDAKRLAQAMGADGVLVGSITAYDPYQPVLGLSLALFAASEPMRASSRQLDPRALAASPSDPGVSKGQWEDRPVSVASENLDAKNNKVLMDVKAYAEGRLNGPNALGWRRYLASMDLYSEFAMNRMLDDVLRQEWVRVSMVSNPVQRPVAGSAEKGR
ncbi:MAG: hypothetical protein WC718_04150 [Phycisphaerales bacterium]